MYKLQLYPRFTNLSPVRVLQVQSSPRFTTCQQKQQYHSFSACADAGYDIKESITDIPRDIQQTML